MNVDKFGHYIHKRLRLSELFECYDNVLTKSENGEFDLKSSRLRGIRLPLESDEAVNKDYVDNFHDNIVKELNKLNGKLRLQTRTDMQNFVQAAIKTKMLEVQTHLEEKFYTKPEIDKLLKKSS